jgi:hypothetical protein
MNSTFMKSLRIVYFTLAMGIVLFMMVAVLIFNLNGALSETSITSAQKSPFLAALVVLTGVVLLVYKAIFPKKLDAIKAMPSLERKLAAWRELSILEAALIEAPSFFAIMLFLLLGVYPLLIWPVGGLILFWLRKPTRDRLIKDTDLSAAEVKAFDASNESQS